MRLRERWPPPQATRNRACLEPRRALPRRVYCCVPENPLRTNRRTKGKARTKPKIQVQITPSILNGFDQDFSHRSVNTISRRYKKKIAKISSISRESKIAPKSFENGRKRKTNGITNQSLKSSIQRAQEVQAFFPNKILAQILIQKSEEQMN